MPDAVPSVDRSRSIRTVELLVAVLWLGAVIATTVQQGVTHQNNNFLIFRAASLHLMHGIDLYAAYPALHEDMFKYSPAFALLFLPLAVIPFALAMLVWNALNAGALYLALGMVLTRRQATVARAVVFLDMLGSLQNVQSNALVAGLMIFTFAWYERNRPVLGTAAALIGTAIKIFPLAAVSVAVFHRRKLSVAVATIAWLPLATVLTFQLRRYGGAANVCALAPSMLIVTPVILRPPCATAATSITLSPFRVAPLPGVTNDTLGPGIE